MNLFEWPNNPYHSRSTDRGSENKVREGGGTLMLTL